MTQTTPEAALKPCPFCGAAAGVMKATGVYQACCSDPQCPANDTYETEERAREIWNTRASTPAPTDEAFDGKEYSAALGKIEYLLNHERDHLAFMIEEKQPEAFLAAIRQDIASFESAVSLIKKYALLAVAPTKSVDIAALEYYPPPFKYSPMGAKIYCQGNEMALDVRGWGNLTGGGAHGLPQEKAEHIQDKFGQWVVDTLNAALEAAPVAENTDKSTPSDHIRQPTKMVQAVAERSEE